MDAIWITVAMVLAIVGGWPVTAGILKLAKSQTIRAVDAAESGGSAAVDATPGEAPPVEAPPVEAAPVGLAEMAESEGEPDAVAETPSNIPLDGDGNGANSGTGGTNSSADGANSDLDNFLDGGADGDLLGELDSRSLGEGNEGPAPAPRPGGDVLRGGLVIGFLERGAVALAIFSGQPVAIAYVVAIKGLGRYPELKETPGASERFIIGTLASMLWAASVGVLAKVLLL